LYKAAFGRLADPAELSNCIEQLHAREPLEALAEGLATSAEFQARHGSSQKVDTEFLNAVYRDGLGRKPDPEGLANWLAQAEKGATRAKVLTAFAASDEARAVATQGVSALSVARTAVSARAQFGRFFWASIAGRKTAIAKTAIDAVLTRGPASISFEYLYDEPHYVYLLFALTRVSAVGCSVLDAHRARVWLPVRDFIRNVRINWHSPSNGILLSESTNGPSIVHINRHYYSSPPADHRLFAPYFAHPEFYRTGLHNDVRGMRGRERNVRIFFAGTISSSAYSENFRFPILNRDGILGHVIARFEWAIKTELSQNGLQPILIVSTSDTRDTLDKYKLSMREYMHVMSGSDFFICPPGWFMPHSHNLVEAMSVGTIPITNYHSYMRPSLSPGSNCLAFSTVDELERVIDCALRMPAGEIQRLRDGVISYYEEYMEPGSFGKKLMECLPSISELVVNDESGR
jgi:hypothetical protein